MWSYVTKYILLVIFLSAFNSSKRKPQKNGSSVHKAPTNAGPEEGQIYTALPVCGEAIWSYKPTTSM